MLMYSGILAGMAQAQVAQERIEFQRRMAEMEPYRAAGRGALEKLLALRPGDVVISDTYLQARHRYSAISCRSCGAPVTSIEPACTYCLTER